MTQRYSVDRRVSCVAVIDNHALLQVLDCTIEGSDYLVQIWYGGIDSKSGQFYVPFDYEVEARVLCDRLNELEMNHEKEKCN